MRLKSNWKTSREVLGTVAAIATIVGTVVAILAYVQTPGVSRAESEPRPVPKPVLNPPPPSKATGWVRAVTKLRAGPGLHTSSGDRLVVGTKITILDECRQDNWCEIHVPDLSKTGFVPADTLEWRK